MTSSHDDSPRVRTPYGSARDLPSFRELSGQLRGAKLLTLFVARKKRREFLEIEKSVDALVDTVDRFYGCLGERNWIFHDSLSVADIDSLLNESVDVAAAEHRFINMYKDARSMEFWLLRLKRHEALRERWSQIDRAHRHYQAAEFDSCTLHLLAVMDGFVNDFEPQRRKGLAARNVEDMTAWDSVVGHHQGLTYALEAFQKPVRKRVEEEVFELHRHGIVHGMITRFDNVVVATKAWNMLFAVADWAVATRKALKPPEPTPSWRDVWNDLLRLANHRRIERGFKSHSYGAPAADFERSDAVVRAGQFLEAWKNGRWAIVARFAPPRLIGARSEGESAQWARTIFGRFPLSLYELTRVNFDQPSVADILGKATVGDVSGSMKLRFVLYDSDGEVALPGDAGAEWMLAIWAPHTYVEARK